MAEAAGDPTRDIVEAERIANPPGDDVVGTIGSTSTSCRSGFGHANIAHHPAL
jgi:hypothetical protein